MIPSYTYIIPYLWEAISHRLIPRDVELPPQSQVSPSKTLKEVECPLREDESLDGIISYLTRKHSGNVHGEDIATLTSRSLLSQDSNNALENVADLTDASYFVSENEPGQWVVDGSLDGVNWMRIDRKKSIQTLARERAVTSFIVSNQVEYGFVRLTQTDDNRVWNLFLCIRAVEFFETLIEER
jgi:hypothetical protein